MPKHVGVTWIPWSTCDRCGFQYPLNMLVSQLGMRLCTRWCTDDLSINYRPFVIEQVLSDDSQEGVPLTPYIQENPEEIIFQ